MTDNDLAEIFACLIILIGGMRCFEWKYAVDHRLHLVGGDSLIHGDELGAATYGYRTDRGDGCKQDIDVDQGGRRGRFGRCNLTRRDRRADEGSSDQADLSFEGGGPDRVLECASADFDDFIYAATSGQFKLLTLQSILSTLW
jgi:hypothetical protein